MATINVWYGTNQQVVYDAYDDFNLVGDVSDHTADMDYRINSSDPGDWLNLPVGQNEATPSQNGGDTRRLAAQGDWNADIPITDLNIGNNIIEVRADDGSVTTETVTVTVSQQSRSLPVSQDLTALADMDAAQQFGQVVDGRWAINGGLECVEAGYDRIFLIGGRMWGDVEIDVTFTIDAFNADQIPNNTNPGLGLLIRFVQHYPSPSAPNDPKWGYTPLGGITWLRWRNGTGSDPDIEMFDTDDSQTQYGKKGASVGETWRMKVEVENESGSSNTIYRCKTWEDGTTEPGTWDFQYTQTDTSALESGSIGLLAHRIEATFESITIQDLEATAPGTVTVTAERPDPNDPTTIIAAEGVTFISVDLNDMSIVDTAVTDANGEADISDQGDEIRPLLAESGVGYSALPSS